MSGEMKTTVVQVIAGPKGVSIDRTGKIDFRDPDILQAILIATPGDVAGIKTAGDNYFQCGGANNYKCGSKLATEIADAATERA